MSCGPPWLSSRKPCRGTEKPPRSALLPHSQLKPPRRAGKSGAPPPQPAFSFKSLRSHRSPLPPSPAAPEEIRNWSWREWTGAPTASKGPSPPGVGPRDPRALARLSGRQKPENSLLFSPVGFKASQTQGRLLDTQFWAVFPRASLVVG